MKTGLESQSAPNFLSEKYDAQLINSSKSRQFHPWWHESKITKPVGSLLVVAYIRQPLWPYKKSAR